jgi:flagellar hook-associated protein 3 FlgL
MSSIPSNISRVPSLLIAQTSSAQIARTNLDLFRIQTQLATGKAISRYSDDAVKAAAISILNERIARADQRKRNLDHADSSLSTIDQALGDANDLVLEAKSIASAQVGTGTTSTERKQQSLVVDSLIQTLLGISNRKSAAGSIFAGSSIGSPAIQPMLGGYRYMGRGPGLTTDLDLGSPFPITLGGTPLGSTSSRVAGAVDLDPALTTDTRLSDLAGARGTGIMQGRLEFSFNGGARVQLDLTGADSVQDVLDTVTGAIRDYEQASSVSILGPGGVSISGGSLSIDVAAGAVQFYDIGSGTTAQDLGLADAAGGILFQPTSPAGAELDAELTWRTPVSSLRGVVGGLGQIKINNLGQSRLVDLSQGATLEDVKNAIEGAGLGLRVELNADASGINIVNEVAAGRTQAFSIEEVAGSNLTATRLGIRSLSAGTRIQDFNDGRGVQIVNGRTDPVTGQLNPGLNTDFTITLGDPAATPFSVDLRPQDMATVQTVIDRINAEAQAAGINVPADFRATLLDGSNGIALMQNAAWATAPSVASANNSQAADQLGLLSATFDPATSSLRGADRATVRVDNLFTRLIDLRDALQNDDTAGITLAGDRLEDSIARLAESRALVGGYAKRVEDGTKRLQDTTVLDQKARSQLQDTDFAEAASRFSLLQTQLQASLQVTASSFSRSLLDFLG